MIIEGLSEKENLRYNCSGALTVTDPNLVSLDFVVRRGTVIETINVRGLIDAPLKLKLQYAAGSVLDDQPELIRQIETDLQAVSDHITG